MSTPKQSVVFLDDEKDYLDFTSRMIRESLGCTVHAFTRPSEALAALKNLSPAVIVTDYFMPEHDGLDFIRRAATLAPDAAFVLITGHLHGVTVEDFVGTPLKGYLEKPFSWRKLSEEIVRVWVGPDAPVLGPDPAAEVVKV